MEPELRELKSKLDSLKQECEQLRVRLHQASMEWQENLIPPPAELGELIFRCRENFDELRKLIVRRSEGPELTINRPDEIASVRQLADLLKDLEKAEEAQKTRVDEIRQSAQDVLERVLALEYSNGGEFAPLQECLAKATELKLALEGSDVHPEAESLASGQHPFAALLTLISEQKSQNYQRLAKLQIAVAESLGMPLALAAMTGDLMEPSPSDSRSADTETTETVADIDAELTQPPVSLPETTPVEAQSIAELAPVEEQTAAQKIAVSIKNGKDEEEESGLRNLIWELIGEDKLGLAFHLVTYMESKSKTTLQAQLTSWLIRGVALGRYVRYDLGYGEIADLLRDDFDNFNKYYFIKDESEWNRESSLLLAASALRPALLAPNTQASRILESLHLGEGLNQLRDYCQAIGDYGSQRRALNTAGIKKVRDRKAWDDEMNSLRQEVESWWSQAPRSNMLYQVAKEVWLEWLKPDRPIHSLLVPVKENDEGKLELVKQYVQRLSSESEINEEVKRTKKEIPRLRGTRGITGKALNRMISFTSAAVKFARRWIELQEYRPDTGNDFSRVQQLKQNLSSRHDAVLAELDALALQQSNAKIQAGISCCQAAVEDIRNLFDPNVPLPIEELAPKYILNADLLRIPSLSMDSDWEPVIGEPKLLRDAILDLVANNSFDWQQALQAQCKSLDHEATGRIIEYLRAKNISEIGQLEELREEHIAQCREKLHEDLKETRNKMENAVALGILREAERADYDAKIVAIEEKQQETVRFKQEQEKLAKIRSEIEKSKESPIADVRERLNTLAGSRKTPDYHRISQLLDKGDVLTANEYIDMLKKGASLPEQKVEKESFSDFFPQKVTEIEQFMEENPNTRLVIQRVQDQKRFGGIDLHLRRKPETKRAAEMLAAWFEVKRDRTIAENNARKILTDLGFDTLELKVTQSESYSCWINVKTKAIREKELCPVYAYGSAANGQYLIFCVWERPSVDDIINEVGATTHSSPVLVFFFGRLTETRRRELARKCRERRRTFLLIDDLLMLYLCGESEPRLLTLFNCALPFTFGEPFATTAGLVPPEIFYGRQQERDSIIAPRGSCLVYGGRQLGKTALLRSVEREVHAPQSGKIAYWLDLKACEIGGGYKSIEHLWSLIAEEFKELEVIPPKTAANTGADKLLGHIKNWLDKDKKRRIILLLDEADNFLESDGQDRFKQTTRMKKLMDDTERRFKVVFAGLHNVQRTTRLENHPLAHYGEPICIGPLLENGELREARNLIKRPFASIGYQLSEDLVTRILSQTNYYPSLIQLYCQQLLRDVNQNHLHEFDSRTTPPYQITERQVEAAYQSKNLRQAIRDRFMWTLQLDQRYEVIAYTIALDSIQSEKGEKGMVNGFAAAWVEKEVRYWWPEGFQRKSTDEIHALLDEMVGLGVLRETHAGYYALRSPNVVFLLGTEEEIEKQLLRHREVPVEYDPKTFRSALDGTRRSPLTVEQESVLRRWEHGVSIIFGSRAAGLDELKDSLVSAVDRKLFMTIDGVSNLADFTKALNDKIGKRQTKEDCTTIILVSDSCDWTKEWVEAAFKKVEGLTSQNSFVRVAFVANPQKTWNLVSQSTKTLEGLGTDNISLKPWDDAALRQWLEDGNVVPAKEDRNKISEITGNWHMLLQRFYQDCRPDLTAWERHLQDLGESLKQPEKAREFLANLGLDDSELQRQRVLRVLVDLEPASAEDLIGITEDIPPDIVESTLEWAKRLRIAFPVGQEEWRVDPLVARVLVSLEEQNQE